MRICVGDNEKLKVAVAERDIFVSKLVKEKSQLKESLSKFQSVKETDSVAIQFDYMIPSMGKK